MRTIALLVLALFASLAPAQPDASDPRIQDAWRLRMLGQQIFVYAQKHNGDLPPDLASLMDLYSKDNPQPTAQLIKNNFLVPGIPAPDVPSDAKADWVNQHSSYAYLGVPGVDYEDIPDWSDIVIAHLKLDAGHPSADNPNNPDAQSFTLAFADNHVEMTTRAEAKRRIDESRAVWEALRTGAPLPDDRQIIWDTQQISKALAAYAKANNDELPPDLGAALPFISSDKKRLATPAQRAAIFLSPSARRDRHIPDAPTADWVNRNTSYVYLAAPDEQAHKPILLSRVEDPSRTILVHGKPDWAIKKTRADGSQVSIIPVATRYGGAAQPAAFAQAMIAESKKVLDFTRRGTPLSDYQHQLRDLRLLNQALLAYAKANNGLLPPDLGSTLQYLSSDELPNPADKARVYLSPRTERLAHVPDDLTPAWINEHATYIYLAAGEPRIALSSIRKAGAPLRILLHPPLNEPCDVLFSFVTAPPYTQPAFAVVESTFVTYSFPEVLEKDIAESKKAFESIRH